MELRPSVPAPDSLGDGTAPECADAAHVRALFEALNASGLRYAVLHGADEVPDRVASDIDVVVDRPSYRRLASFLSDFARAHGGWLCQEIRHEPTACYRVVAIPRAGALPSFLKLDASTDFRRDGRVLFTGPELFEGARHVGLAWSVAPGVEFAGYLAKCVLKGRIREDQLAALGELWRADPPGCREELGRLVSAGHVALVAGVLEHPERPDSVTSLLTLGPKIRTGAFRKHPLAALAYPIRQGLRALARVARRTGFQVALLGPDGVGKSAVLERTEAALVSGFRSTARLHLRPGLLGKRDAAGVGDAPPIPYGRPTYGVVSSVLKLGYLLFDYVVGYWVRVRPALVRSTLIMCDRYYLDVVADPERYRYGGPAGLPAAMRGLVPGPDVYLVLTAPVETIQARKAEVSPSQTAVQLAAYRRVIELDRRAVEVDASRDVEAVVRDAVAAVLRAMSERVTSR